MKVVCMSDIHGRMNFSVPTGDVVVFAGDFIRLRQQQMIQLFQFNTWLGSLPVKHKIVIAGNHDEILEKDPEARKHITNAIYLQDESVTIDGVKFYGSPYQPRFYDWAFNLDRGEQLIQKWKLIPDDTDVLITHTPPVDILDCDRNGFPLGCYDLREAIKRVRPKLHVFGHIHEGYGMRDIEGTTFINASLCDRTYEVVRKPIVIEV